MFGVKVGLWVVDGWDELLWWFVGGWFLGCYRSGLKSNVLFFWIITNTNL